MSKKTLTKVLAIVLVLVMTVSVLAACGDKGNTTTPSGGDSGGSGGSSGGGSGPIASTSDQINAFFDTLFDSANEIRTNTDVSLDDNNNIAFNIGGGLSIKISDNIIMGDGGQTVDNLLPIEFSIKGFVDRGNKTEVKGWTANDNGNFVYANSMYVEYDENNVAHVGKQRYDSPKYKLGLWDGENVVVKNDTEFDITIKANGIESLRLYYCAADGDGGKGIVYLTIAGNNVKIDMNVVTGADVSLVGDVVYNAIDGLLRSQLMKELVVSYAAPTFDVNTVLSNLLNKLLGTILAQNNAATLADLILNLEGGIAEMILPIIIDVLGGEASIRENLGNNINLKNFLKSINENLFNAPKWSFYDDGAYTEYRAYKQVDKKANIKSSITLGGTGLVGTLLGSTVLGGGGSIEIGFEKEAGSTTENTLGKLSRLFVAINLKNIGGKIADIENHESRDLSLEISVTDLDFSGTKDDSYGIGQSVMKSTYPSSLNFDMGLDLNISDELLELVSRKSTDKGISYDKKVIFGAAQGGVVGDEFLFPQDLKLTLNGMLDLTSPEGTAGVLKLTSENFFAQVGLKSATAWTSAKTLYNYVDGEFKAIANEAAYNLLASGAMIYEKISVLAEARLYPGAEANEIQVKVYAKEIYEYVLEMYSYYADGTSLPFFKNGDLWGIWQKEYELVTTISDVMYKISSKKNSIVWSDATLGTNLYYLSGGKYILITEDNLSNVTETDNIYTFGFEKIGTVQTLISDYGYTCYIKEGSGSDAIYIQKAFSDIEDGADVYCMYENDNKVDTYYLAGVKGVATNEKPVYYTKSKAGIYSSVECVGILAPGTELYYLQKNNNEFIYKSVGKKGTDIREGYFDNYYDSLNTQVPYVTTIPNGQEVMWKDGGYYRPLGIKGDISKAPSGKICYVKNGDNYTKTLFADIAIGAEVWCVEDNEWVSLGVKGHMSAPDYKYFADVNDQKSFILGNFSEGTEVFALKNDSEYFYSDLEYVKYDANLFTALEEPRRYNLVDNEYVVNATGDYYAKVVYKKANGADEFESLYTQTGAIIPAYDDKQSISGFNTAIQNMITTGELKVSNVNLYKLLFVASDKIILGNYVPAPYQAIAAAGEKAYGDGAFGGSDILSVLMSKDKGIVAVVAKLINYNRADGALTIGGNNVLSTIFNDCYSTHSSKLPTSFFAVMGNLISGESNIVNAYKAFEDAIRNTTANGIVINKDIAGYTQVIKLNRLVESPAEAIIKGLTAESPTMTVEAARSSLSELGYTLIQAAEVSADNKTATVVEKEYYAIPTFLYNEAASIASKWNAQFSKNINTEVEEARLEELRKLGYFVTSVSASSFILYAIPQETLEGLYVSANNLGGGAGTQNIEIVAKIMFTRGKVITLNEQLGDSWTTEDINYENAFVDNAMMSDIDATIKLYTEKNSTKTVINKAGILATVEFNGVTVSANAYISFVSGRNFQTFVENNNLEATDDLVGAGCGEIEFKTFDRDTILND